jgi:hypothetical protein
MSLEGITMPDHVATLEKRFVAFDKKKAQLEVLSTQLIPIIHQPGWTTPAEFSLIELLMEELEAQADRIVTVQTKLVAAAKLVGTTRTGPIARPLAMSPLHL